MAVKRIHERLLDTIERQWPPIPTLGHEPAVGPPPFQQPRPPILAVLRADEAVTAAHRAADGLHLVGPWDPDAAATAWREVAHEGAHLVVEVAVDPADPAGAGEVVAAMRDLGPAEIVLAAPDATGLDDALAAYAAVAERVELRTGA